MSVGQKGGLPDCSEKSLGLLRDFCTPIRIVMILVSPTKGLLFFVLPQQTSEASSDSITKLIIDLMIFCVFVTRCIISS